MGRRVFKIEISKNGNTKITMFNYELSEVEYEGKFNTNKIIEQCRLDIHKNYAVYTDDNMIDTLNYIPMPDWDMNR
jgi:hypothetical protein